MARFPTPHVATVLAYVEDGVEWVEGERGDAPEATSVGEVRCYLFLPLGSEEQAPRSRKVTRPTVMWDPAEVVGQNPTADGELLILAPELVAGTGAAEVRWQIEGNPQPFGPPGLQPIGAQATLKRVEG